MVSATQIARVFTVIQRQTQPRLRCIRFGESPFPDVISFVGHFYQRLTPIYVFKKDYFVDSDSEDYGILFLRKMFMGGQLIRYILVAIAGSPLIYKYTKYHKQVHTTTKYRAQLHTTNILQF